MSFGFSVGDFLAGASLAYKLYKSLSETKGASRDYRTLTSKLLIVHKVLLQVEQLRAANQLAQSTLNAVLFLTNGINEAMGEFMVRLDHYREGLQTGGSGKPVKDIYLKSKWSLKMPDEIKRLSEILNSNLLSLSILIQMACWFNAEGRPEYSVDFYQVGQSEHSSKCGFPHVKLCATLTNESADCSSPSFGMVPRAKASDFFRPGQVFSVAVAGRLFLHKTDRDIVINWGSLPFEWVPLESIPNIHEREKERAIRQKKNLKDIHKLPLAAMFQFGSVLDDGRVRCHLCSTKAVFHKAFWVDNHFRVNHNAQYLELRDKSSWYQRHKYIGLDEMGTDRPVLSVRQIEGRVRKLSELPLASSAVDPWVGSIMLRRFVVVRQGTESCLCLGIHTYAGRGSSDQPDQELFSILHTSKDIPPLLPREKGIKLQPIRLKAEHPSTALPSSARIHFGRVYEVQHDVGLKSIGLIHDSSMEALTSQFDAHCPTKPINSSNQGAASTVEGEASADATVMPADSHIAKEIRDNVKSINGIDSALHAGNRFTPRSWVDELKVYLGTS